MRAVDAGRDDGQPHVARFVDEADDFVDFFDFRGEHRRHQLRRVVRFQPGGLVGKQRIGGGVRFVEAVFGEFRHQVEDVGRLFFRHAALYRAADEDVFVARHFFGFLFAHRAAQVVRFAEAVVGEFLRDLHDLFLVNHDAVGGLQDAFEVGVRVLDFGEAVFAVDEVIHHAGAERAGAEEGDEGDDVLEGIRTQFADEFFHAAGFELEDGGGVGGLQQFVGGGVVQRQGGDVQRRFALAGAAAVDVVKRPVDDGQGAQAEEIEFDQPHRFDVVFVELGGDARARAFAVERGEVGEFGRRDDHAARVFADVARQPFQLQADVDDVAHFFVFFVELLHRFRAQLRLVLAFRAAAECVRQGDAEDGRHGGDQFIDHRIGHAEDATDVAQYRLRRHRAVRGDLRDALRAVFVRDVFDDFVAPLHAEIDVEVGHGNALRIQEAFEEEVVGERVKVGDFQRVGDERARAGTASGADRNVVVLRPLDEVGDDEEVAGKSHLVDNAQLDGEALVVGRAFAGTLAFVGKELREAQLQPVFRALHEEILNRYALWQREIGQVVFAQRQLQIAAGGDRMRVGENLRRVGKALRHHRIAGEVVFLREIARALVVGAQPAVADADAHLVHVVIVRRRETGEVGGNGGDTQFASGVAAPVEILRLARLAVPRQLQIVAVGENALPEGGAFFRALRIAAAKKTRQIAVNTAGKRQ